MSLPNRHNPYRFDPYLERRAKIDYYADDPFLQQVVRHFARSDFARIDAAARAVSQKASYRWRDLADAMARLEQRPTLQTWDAHHRRVDRVLRPAEALTLESEVFSEGLFSKRTDPLTRIVKMFLIYENGEACTACPLVCTEGMVAVLDAHAESAEAKAILEHVKEGRDGRFGVGAQFLSEIQGGSDVPANVCEAVLEDGAWRLFGTKFFCSVAHADYAVVTAKPRGSEAVGLFVAPLWQPGHENQRRNGLTVDRLKWKMGTCELPTAEMTFEGTVAYPVGPLDRGLANVVGVVLTLSRLTVGIASAASMRRAAREAAVYAEFREAFGQRLTGFPMVQAQLADMDRASRRTTAGAFKIHHAFHAPDKDERRTLEARELVMLQKFASSEDSTETIREAMAIFGGHGVMEDFSCLPRLFRDSAVNELWEGPRNVLLAQIHRDLHRASRKLAPREFVTGLLRGADAGVVAPIAATFEELVPLEALPLEACRRWDRACRTLVHAYQDVALAEVEAS